jgi:hypothetical protein
MSVELNFITLIVRKDAVERLTPPGRALVLALFEESPRVTRQDAHILATDFMNPKDVGWALERLKGAGLRTLEGVGPAEAWIEAAVVDTHTGPTRPAPWLAFRAAFRKPEPEFGPGTYFITLPTPKSLEEVPRAWLKEHSEGPLAEVPYNLGEERWKGGETTFVQKFD